MHSNADLHRFAGTAAYLSRHRLPHLLFVAPHAGAGGARKQAIKDRMLANICRSTATWAIWKVT